MAAAYFAGARLGLHLAYANKNVTAVWPPTGISVACLLLFGLRITPAVYIGAFLANLSNGAGPNTSLLIAIGNTAAPVVAVILVAHLGRVRVDLARVRDVVVLLLLGGPVAMTISATLGSASLAVSGSLPWSSYWSTWTTWWIGDSMGVVIGAPLILSLAARSWRDVELDGRRWAEGSAVLALLVAAAVLIFHTRVPLAFLVFPVAAWAAIRFGQFGAIVAVAIVTSISIPFTVHGHGPFVAGLSITGSLSALQAFNGSVTLSALMLAALTGQARRAQAELRRSADRLELRVRERTAELQVSLEQLQDAQSALVRSERLSAIGEMATMVGHELRNPIGAALNRLFLIRTALEPDGAEPVMTNLDMAESQIARAATLADDLMAYVRERAPDRVEMSFGDAVDEVLEATEVPRGVEVVVEGRGVEILADRVQLVQILTNLVTNAYQVLTAGGSIRLAAAPNGATTAITVDDTGPGIDAGQLERLFEPFVTTRPEGTGLGLAIVQRLAEAHGGTVSGANRPEGGARFEVLLPTANDGHDGEDQPRS